MDECKPLRGGAGLLAAAGRRRGHGKAVQVNLMKPTLKPPGTKRLKPKYDEPLSNFAFNVNLRRYAVERGVAGGCATEDLHGRAVQVDPIKPTLKPPGTKRLKL